MITRDTAVFRTWRTRRHCRDPLLSGCLPAHSSKQEHDWGVFGEQCGSTYHRLFHLNRSFRFVIKKNSSSCWKHQRMKMFQLMYFVFLLSSGLVDCWSVVEGKIPFVCWDNFLKNNNTFVGFSSSDWVYEGLFSCFCILHQCLYMILSYLFITNKARLYWKSIDYCFSVVNV